MIGLQDVIKVLNKKGYALFEGDKKPFNLNYIGIRDMGGQWNDQFVLMWKYKGNWSFYTWMGTTDPGAYYLKNPMNVKGTAIMAEGQHRGLYKLGRHRGRYDALVQASKVKVYRDGDRDSKPELNSLKVYEGFFGINSHRAHTKVEVSRIGKYSAGCQVTWQHLEYLVALWIWKQGFKSWPTLTYTLLNINDFN